MSQAENIDIASEEFLAEPFLHFKTFRQEPISKNKFIHSWVITRYEDVLEVLNKPKHFSSSFRTESENLRRKYKNIVSVPSLLTLDPPEHTRLKRMLSPLFTAGSLKRFAFSIENIAAKLCENTASKREFDFVQEFAVPIPVEIISSFLQLPTGFTEHLRKWSLALIEIASVDLMLDGEEKQKKTEVLLKEISKYHKNITEEIEKKVKNPGSDLISKLTKVKDEQETLSIPEIVRFVELLLFSSHETTATALTNCLLCLLKFPEYWRMLKNDKNLVPQFVEEMLRYTSPVMGLFRKATQNILLGACEIAAGDKVYLSLASANYDEQKFIEPEVFNIHRKNNHIAFGHGVHYCLGAQLARQELCIILENILEKIPQMELMNEEIVWKRNLLVRVPRQLMVRTI